MKIFISSLISGFEAERAAARRAVVTLRHEPVMAEDFGALPTSPQLACLQALRTCDLVVLILGERYGFVPAGSSLSATHQEYREARGSKPVLAFVQQGVSPEPEQAAFIDEVQGWEGGLFRAGFFAAEDLQDAVTRALHDVALANAVAPLNEQELEARAIELLPADEGRQSSSAFLHVALAGGPTQRILRPAELEAEGLAEHLQQSAMFGEHRLFDRSRGSRIELDGADLLVHQESGASIRLTEQGSLALRLPIDDPAQGGRFNAMAGMMVIIEEDIRQRLATALAFAAAVIEHVDPTQRLTHLVVATRVTGAEYRAWRSRAENDASPNSVQIGMAGSRDRVPIAVSARRAALRLDRTELANDILVPLRRQFPRG